MAMADEDDLFGDLDVPGIVIEKPFSDDNKKADQAWLQWARMTSRPQQRNPERDFVKAYKKLLNDGHNHGRMLTVIAGAARMPVRPRDPKDLRRVLYALQSVNGHTEAIALLNEKHRPVIPFPDGAEPVFKSTVSDLEAACRINAQDWTTNDHDACSILITKCTPEELDKLADATALRLGAEGVLPNDMLRNVRSLEHKNKAQLKQEIYDAGRSEEAQYEGILFAADSLADMMRRRGASAASIRKEHDKAPEGYWDAVLDVILDEPMRSFTSIYDQLNKKFSWHPNSRLTDEG